MTWAADELSGVNLGDERLNQRAVRLLDRFAAQPTVSIPGVCADWAETQAAYRLLANEAVSWEALLEAHWTSAQARMGAHEEMLCLQDTSELLDQQRFANPDEARRAVFEFIEGWYNPNRRHSAIDYLSPIDFERRYHQTLANNNRA